MPKTHPLKKKKYKETDWAEVFDIIASEYAGYSTFQSFLTLTMKQLCALLSKIRIRNIRADHQLMSFHAQLQGAEIKPLSEILGVSLDESEFSDDVDKQLELRANQILAEKKRAANVG